MFSENLNTEMTRYDPATFPGWIRENTASVNIVKDNRKIRYYNCPAAFDIETSSFTLNGEKQATMYLWCFGLNGSTVYGRTWDEFGDLLEQLTETLDLDIMQRLLVYVHNLGYEFEWIRTYINWNTVFSLKEHKPVKALTEGGIEFRCSLQLSGYSLDELGKHLTEYPVRKLTGSIDYSLIRHSETPLTPDELAYVRNDVRVVMAYIQEEIHHNVFIARIPLTKTGYVRQYCRNAVLYTPGSHHKKDRKFHKARKLFSALIMTPDDYRQIRPAFQGGFTHTNCFKAGKVISDVGSIDFTSSYPAQMIAKQFPMSPAEIVRIDSWEQFEENLQLYCCVFDVEIFGLQSVLWMDHPLARSKCWNIHGEVLDNGRVVSADHLYTTLTEQDFFTLREFYRWDRLNIGTFRRFMRTYLPRDFLLSILDLYKAKTELKGVAGKEVEYQRSKEMINSAYGMTVTDPVRPEIIYEDDDWHEKQQDLDKALKKYNNSINRFLYYPWGIWVCAYARRALFTGITSFDDDYIYSDTDSIKCEHLQEHMEYINDYNEQITSELRRACEVRDIDFELTRPRTIKGVEKPLGVWDIEGGYDRAKFLRAKCYMTEKDGQMSLTVSGLKKEAAIPYLLELCGGDHDKVFEMFDDDMYIPAGHTGKNVHTYMYEPMTGIVTDYLGNTFHFYEASGVHMTGADYSMDLDRQAWEWLAGYRYID